MKLVLLGRPIPAVRMTQRGKYVKDRAQKYLAYKDAVGWAAKLEGCTITKDAVAVEVHIYLAGGKEGDADNYAKAICDSLNGIAWEDDRQVRRLVVEKHHCTPPEERAEVEIKGWEG